METAYSMEMVYSKDRELIGRGDWLMDTTGVYEVTDIDSQFVYLREVEFEDDGNYRYIGSRRITHKEAGTMVYHF